MKVTVQCLQCGDAKEVTPYRAKTYKFCSYACRGKWRSENWTGENHPSWSGGEREKTCEYCGDVFRYDPKGTVATFRKQKFCSKPCADKGGFRRSGKDHPNYKPSGRRHNRRGKQGAWARNVISRDGATCQHCGATDVELHAHHIKPFETNPELRADLENGITFCFQCHWAVHTALAANEVNSGNTLPDNAGGNPEPSFGRKPIEGVTTRGQAYRRWCGHCEWCGTFLSKRWSDVKNNKHVFCSKRCAGKFKAANRTYRPWINPDQPPTAVTSPTSASPETDEIV